MIVKRTYKYRLFRCDRKDEQLHNTIDTASEIYNHALELHQRYYRLYGMSLSFGRLKSHIAKLRKQHSKYKHWQIVGSQAVQDIIERIERGYTSFFKKDNESPPQHKVFYKYKSFTLKQHGAGYKLLEDNRVRIGKKVYQKCAQSP